MIDQSLMSAFDVRYEVEVISIVKRDGKRAIEVVTMLRIRFRKSRRGLKQRMKIRGNLEGLLGIPTGHDKRVGCPCSGKLGVQAVNIRLYSGGK